jgi:hypothetical protein
MPRAINSVVFRLAVFYVGSLVLLALAAAVYHLQTWHQPVRHVLLIHRCTGRERYHEFRGADLPALVGGWYAVPGRVLEMALERVGFTGNYRVIAETPLMDEFLDKDAKE